MEFEINNNQTLVVKQYGFDSDVIVEALDNKDVTVREYSITPGDFITMLNWYQYQIEIGNLDLNY